MPEWESGHRSPNFCIPHWLCQAGIILEHSPGLLVPSPGHCLVEKALLRGSTGTGNIAENNIMEVTLHFDWGPPRYTVPRHPVELCRAALQGLHGAALSWLYVCESPTNTGREGFSSALCKAKTEALGQADLGSDLGSPVPGTSASKLIPLTFNRQLFFLFLFF